MVKVAYDPSANWSKNSLTYLRNSVGEYYKIGVSANAKDAEILIKSPHNVIPISEYPCLRIIASNTTSPWHIPLRHCRDRGIKVITLEGNPVLDGITSTAEHTCGLIHAAHRNILAASLDVTRNLVWNRYKWGVPQELQSSNLLIIGYGRIGSMVANMMDSVVGSIAVYDPKNDHEPEDLEYLLPMADIVALCCSLTDSSRYILNHAAMERMPLGSIIVNTAQGSCLDHGALLDHMNSGHIRAAALDVLPDEFGPGISHDMERIIDYAAGHPNLILTPHIAGSTAIAWKKTQMATIEAIIEEIKEWN